MLSAPAAGELVDVPLRLLDHQVHVGRVPPCSWISSARSVTIFGPKVITGTKWPSIDVDVDHPGAGIEHLGDLSRIRPKSADRIEGATSGIVGHCATAGLYRRRRHLRSTNGAFGTSHPSTTTRASTSRPSAFASIQRSTS